MDRLEHRFRRYNALLHLYPGAYRKHYHEQMLQTLADMLDDPERSRVRVWLQTGIDFPVSVIRQQLAYTVEAMAVSPKYIKWSESAGAVLLLPFFILILLHSVSSYDLEHSIFWHTNVLFTWLILLPCAAIVINAYWLLRWLRLHHHEAEESIWHSLVSNRALWPQVGIFIIACGIIGLALFHDSVHCITGNPIRELHNPRDTLHCITER